MTILHKGITRRHALAATGAGVLAAMGVALLLKYTMRGQYRPLLLELQRAVDGLQFEARPGKMLPLAISVGAAIFPHDGDTYETLLANADSRMYRDKTRRKRESAGANPGHEHARPMPPESLSEVELQRAATGVL